MITHNEQTTSVQFGTGKKGSVGLTGRRGSLTIQQLCNSCEIGQPFDVKTDVSELPKVELNFTETSSVDSLIKVLEEVKRRMEAPDPNVLAYAC